MSMETIVHGLTVDWVDADRYVHACPCGFETAVWETRYHPDPTPSPRGCPRDPQVRALVTLQFSWGGLLDGRPADNYQVHLVRCTNRGTPGPSLCGIDRFGENSPGWSVGGGTSGPHTACAGCAAVAAADFPGLPVNGLGADVMRAALAATMPKENPPT